MRGFKTSFWLLPLVIVFSLCAPPSKEQSVSSTDETSESTEVKKDVSELTYMEVYQAVFSEFGSRREWHGEEMPNTLTEMLTISSGEPCGEDNCGKALQLKNSSDRSIGVVVKGAYDIQGDQGYMAVEYEVGAGESIKIGCSHFCYNGESYLFDRQIVGSWYMDE